MKKFRVLVLVVFFLIFANFVFSGTVNLKSGAFSLDNKAKQIYAENSEKGLYFIELKDRDSIAKMQQKGVEFINYMGDSIYLVKGKSDSFSSDVLGLLKFSSEMKLSPSLQAKEINNKIVSIYLFGLKMSKSFTNYLKDNNVKYTKKDGRIDCEVKNTDELKLIASHNNVMWVAAKEPRKVINNFGAQEMSDVDAVQHAPYNLTGAGERVGVWDGGEIFPHQEFGDRITLKDHSAAAKHATHVAGTIGSSGEFDAKSEGMATAVSIFSYDYNGDVNSEFVPANLFFGIQVSNHSWGWGHDPVKDKWDIERFGDYEAFSAIQDKVAYENNLILIRSAGNSRDEFAFTQTIDPTSTSKNVVTIGALYKEKLMTSYSSWGPCDDGRVKPDICAKGGGGWLPNDLMYSTLPDNSYGTMMGTSMAAPVVTGSMALILELYHRYNEGEIPAALGKGLILHTAEDLYNPGPDYMTGFGVLQVKAAVDFFINSNYGEGNDNTIIKAFVDNGDTKTYSFEIAEGVSKEIKVTACWQDVEGSPSAAKALVNDVDIKVIAPSGAEFFPYVLDVANPTADATKGVNSVDNVEQIDFTADEAGTWTIEVKGTDIDSLNIPEVYVFANTFVNAGAQSEPKVDSGIKEDIAYSKLNLIKGNVDDVFSFNAHVFDDDGYIKSVNWGFSNILLDASKAIAGDFALTADKKVYGFSLNVADNNGNNVKGTSNYILLEDKDGLEQLPEEGVSDIAIAYGEVKKYYYSFPIGAVDPQFTTTGTGDIDIFVSYLNAPTVSYNTVSNNYEFAYSHPFMFSSASSDGNELVKLNSPLREDGVWCVQVYGWAEGSMTFSLNVSYKPVQIVFPNSSIVSPVNGSLIVPAGSTVLFKGEGSGDLGVETVKWKKGSENAGEGFSNTMSFVEAGDFTITATAVNRGGSEDPSPAEYSVSVVSADSYPETVYCPLVYQDSVYDTELYLINSSDVPNSAVILGLSDYGSIVASKEISSIGVGEKKLYNVGDIFPGVNFVTGVKIISSSPLVGFVRVKTKEKGDKQGSAVFVKAYEKSIVPHIHEVKDTEHQWGTSFGLISDVVDDISFDYFSSSVDKIRGNYAPFSVKERFISLFDLDMPTNQMWGIFSSAKSQGIAAMEMFEKVDGNQQQTILSLSDETFSECYLAHIDITAGWWTGLSLVNPFEYDASVTIKAFDSEGNLLVDTDFTLSAYGRKVDLIQNFFDEEVPATIAWVKIESTVGVTGYEIFGYVNNEQIAGINILGKLSSELTFLHVSKDVDAWTGVAVLNPSSSSVNVTFTAYSDNGDVVTALPAMEIKAGSKYVGLVSSLFAGITNISYIKATSDSGNLICGFELFGITSQVYLNGIEAVSNE